MKADEKARKVKDVAVKKARKTVENVTGEKMTAEQTTSREASDDPVPRDYAGRQNIITVLTMLPQG